MKYVRCLALLATCAAACRPTGQPADELRQATAAPERQDVESILKSGRWEKRAGLGAGMAWEYLDGGKVRIYSDGEVDEAYRWEVLSRSERDRKITIRYWKVTDPPNEHREFVFAFGADGNTAEVENWLHKNGQIELRGESLQYRIR